MQGHYEVFSTSQVHWYWQTITKRQRKYTKTYKTTNDKNKLDKAKMHKNPRQPKQAGPSTELLIYVYLWLCMNNCSKHYSTELNIPSYSADNHHWTGVVY